MEITIEKQNETDISSSILFNLTSKNYRANLNISKASLSLISTKLPT